MVKRRIRTGSADLLAKQQHQQHQHSDHHHQDPLEMAPVSSSAQNGVEEISNTDGNGNTNQTWLHRVSQISETEKNALKQLKANNYHVPLEKDKDYYLISHSWFDSYRRHGLSSYLGVIDQSSLVIGGVIKADIEELKDYDIVDPICWHALKKLYTIRGPEISRRAVDVSSNKEVEEIILELDPPSFTIVQLTDPQASFANSGRQAPVIKLSASNSSFDLENQIRLHLVLSTLTEFRIWKVSGIQNSTVSISDFAQLQDKELLDMCSAEYNQSTLYECGLAHSCQLIIDIKRFGHWQSENSINRPKFEGTDGLATTSRELRAEKKLVAQDPSKIGLTNLGNTCYMNSALQCLLHINELTEYFTSAFYEHEINVKNPLSSKGLIAKSFANLCKMVVTATSSAISPREFKMTIGKVNPSFGGYLQQDSQEFLVFLIDALHEDLNRVKVKPYIERPTLNSNDKHLINEMALKCWDFHKKRNDSIIVDYFTGMYKSTLVCPECQNVSVTFDPFMDLILPLPVKRQWKQEILLFPLSNTHKIRRINCCLDACSTISDLETFIRKKGLCNSNSKILITEVFNHQIYRNFRNPNEGPLSRLFSVSDLIVAYELEDGENLRYMPVCCNSSNLFSDKFGFPFFISLSEGSTETYQSIYEKCMDRLSLLTTVKESNIHVPERKVESIPQNINRAETPSNLQVERNDNDKSMASNSEFHQYMDEDVKEASEIRPFSLILLKSPRDRDSRTLVESDRLTVGSGLNIHESTSRSSSSASRRNWSGSNEGMAPTADANGLRKSVDIEEVANDENDVIRPAPIVINSRIAPPATTADVISQHSTESSEQNNTDSPLLGAASLFRQFETTDSISLLSSSAEELLLCRFSDPAAFFTPEDVSCYNLMNWSTVETESKFDESSAAPNTFSGKQRPEQRERQKGNKQSQQQPGDSMKRISIYNCLDEFSRQEQLGENDPWFCPSCKELRRALKVMEIWKAPDILIMCLKRFSSVRDFRDKLENFVEFPVYGLDLTDRVRRSSGDINSGTSDFVDNRTEKVDEESRLIYDLIAVDNHYGGLGGGHYTSYAKISGKFFCFDDSFVNPVSDERVVSSAAYLLFYKRRSSKPLGEPTHSKVAEFLRAKEVAEQERSQNMAMEKSNDLVEDVAMAEQYQEPNYHGLPTYEEAIGSL